MELQVGKRFRESNLEFFQACLNDYTSLAEMILEFKSELDGMLFSEEDLISCPQSTGNPLSHLKASLQSPDSLVLFAKANHKAVAFLKFDRGQTSKSRHRGILTMAVKQSHWGRGIGRRLLKELELWASERSIFRLELNVLANNYRAISLYKSEGYQLEGYKAYAAQIGGSYLGGYLMAKIIKP